MAGCNGTRSAPSTIAMLRRFASSGTVASAKLFFGPERLMNSTLFAIRDNNTLEINYLRDHSSEYAHSVFYGCSVVFEVFIIFN